MAGIGDGVSFDTKMVLLGGGIGVVLMLIGLLCSPSAFTFEQAALESLVFISGMAAVVLVLGRLAR